MNTIKLIDFIGFMRCSFFTLMLLCLYSCNSQQQKDAAKNIVIKPVTTALKEEKIPVDNKKDPVCGMPVSAGIKDTSYYKGNVYGFCSKECKEEFVKTPVKYIKASELKANTKK